MPVGELELRSRVLRPGRSVELVEAVLSADGRDVARAAAWRVLRTDAGRCAPRPPCRRRCRTRPATVPSGGWVDGYLSAVEWRFADGRFDVQGPATVWTRLRHPLVPDEQPSPLTRVLAVADSGNGLSQRARRRDAGTSSTPS